jgi:cobalt-zinc-cadmium efflux system membrane fusion protein
MRRGVWVVVGGWWLIGACAREAAPPEAELPTLDVTTWTERSELFMEYPPLVAGQPALFAVHLTRLSDFSAMDAGQPRLEFTPEAGGAPSVLQGGAPSRPGVFRVEGPAPPAGPYRWALVIEAPGLTDRHELGRVTVFAEQAEAVAAAEAAGQEDASAISYLKEPQWTNGFATVVVREAELRTSIRAPATVHPLPGGEAIIAAPAAGRLRAAALPSIGDRVRTGQVLAWLEPRLAEGGADRATLAAAVAEAQATLDAARADLARAERLLAERAVPARRVEEAQRAVTIAEARLEAARARLAQRDETLRTGGGAAAGNAFTLVAPISGRLADVTATLGASYEEGAPLFRIVRTDRVELQVQVPTADVARARQVASVELEIPGLPDPVVLMPRHVHDAGVLDPATRALPLQMDVTNSGERLLIGQAATAVLYGRDRQRVPVVPREAVLMEAGRPYVFVQIGGERFLRRYIEIATRDGDIMGVRGGVKVGERIVTRGAYDVQLASASGGVPAEGHVH